MTSKERLEQYIKGDTIYQDYLNKHSSYVSDFDKFCIQHCQDIKNILYQNEELKKQLETRNELVAEGTLIEMKLRDENRRLRKEYQDTYKDVRIEIKEYKNQQKEFINYLEDKIKIVHKTSIWEVTNIDLVEEAYEEILSKYKEIIGGVEDENK